ncbi:MAG: hypothetical protein U5K28_02595 [Halobacteriales archaeon]|nr:hypothetical protein [Halobacteriales archaeon]
MPIDTDSDRWNSASTESSSKAHFLEFLKSNQERAFTAEEISREVLGTDFEIDIPDIPDGEYTIGNVIGSAAGSAKHSARMEAFVRVHLSLLIYEGKVEARIIPINEGGEKIDVAHYTISN